MCVTPIPASDLGLISGSRELAACLSDFSCCCWFCASVGHSFFQIFTIEISRQET